MSGEVAQSIRIGFRAREGCGMLEFNLKDQKTTKLGFKSAGIDYMSHDTVGNHIATWGRKTGKVEVFTALGELIMTVDVEKVMGLKLSHKGTYLAIWKAPEMESRKENLLIYKIATQELLTHVWNPTWPCVEWDQADINTVIFSLHTGVHVYEDLTKEPVHTLPGKWNQVQLSYTSPSVIAAMYIPPENDRDKTPSVIKMVRIPKLDKILLEHKLRLDDANIIWNRKGTAALLKASLDLDESGKSYYGETTLLVFNIQTKKITPIDTGRTPVHDVKWAESGKEFCVVYGKMPSNKASIYSEKGELLFNFDIAPRNTVHWSPHSRLFSLCGFGNLPGNVINFDRSTLDKKASASASIIGKFQMSSVTKFAWSPCSRYIMCCTTHPRMTTANKLCIYKHNGEKLYEEAHTELYDAVWMPHSSKSFPQRDPSPMRGVVEEAEKPKAATFRAAGRDPGLANAIKSQLSANKKAGYSAPGANTRTSESFTSWRSGGKVEEAAPVEEKPPTDGKRRAPDILLNGPKPKKEKAPKGSKKDISEIVDQLPLEDFTTKSYPDVVKAMKAAKKKVQDCAALRDKTLNDMQIKKLSNYNNFKAEAAYLEKLSKSGKTSQ